MVATCSQATRPSIFSKCQFFLFNTKQAYKKSSCLKPLTPWTQSTRLVLDDHFRVMLYNFFHLQIVRGPKVRVLRCYPVVRGLMLWDKSWSKRKAVMSTSDFEPNWHVDKRYNGSAESWSPSRPRLFMYNSDKNGNKHACKTYTEMLNNTRNLFSTFRYQEKSAGRENVQIWFQFRKFKHRTMTRLSGQSWYHGQWRNFTYPSYQWWTDQSVLVF